MLQADPKSRAMLGVLAQRGMARLLPTIDADAARVVSRFDAFARGLLSIGRLPPLPSHQPAQFQCTAKAGILGWR